MRCQAPGCTNKATHIVVGSESWETFRREVCWEHFKEYALEAQARIKKKPIEERLKCLIFNLEMNEREVNRMKNAGSVLLASLKFNFPEVLE